MENQIQIVDAEQFDAPKIDMTVTKNDLIILRTVEEEKLLKLQLRDLEVQLKAVNAERNKLNEANEDIQRQCVASAFDLERMDKLVETLFSFGFSFSIRQQLQLADYTKKGFNVILKAEFQGSAGSYKYNYDGKSTFVPFPKQFNVNLAEIANKQKEAADIEEQICRVRKNLQDLPMLERQAIADVTRHTLSQTAGGQKLLDRVDSVQPLRLLEGNIKVIKIKKKAKSRK